jgi:hypothetical protein
MVPRFDTESGGFGLKKWRVISGEWRVLFGNEGEAFTSGGLATMGSPSTIGAYVFDDYYDTQAGDRFGLFAA